MKYTTRLLITLYAASLLASFLPATAQNPLQQQKDSLRRALTHTEGTDKLRTYNRLYYLYMAEVSDDAKMDTLLALFRETEEEAIRQGNAKMQGMVYGNTIICHINRSEHDRVIEKAPAYLDFFVSNGQWRFYYQIHMQLIFALSAKGEYEQAAAEAEKMYARAKTQDDKAGMATALYASGTVYNQQQRLKEEEESFRECIRLLWEVDGYDNILTQAYAFLCMSLRAQERYDDLLQVVPRYEKAIARFEEAAGRTQPEARGNLYLALMNTYIDLRKYDKAETYLARLEGLVSNNISQYELGRARALICKAHGDYPAALAAIDSALTFMQESPFDLNQARKIKMEILARMGRHDEAFAMLDGIIASGDSIKNVEINARFDELRTRYEVEKHIAEKERNFHYFLFAIGIAAVLLLLLAGTVYYNRLIATKNRKLYERIKEQDRIAQELSRLTPEGEASAVTPQTVLAETPDSTATVEQRLMLVRLRQYLLAADNLLNAENRREDIVSALATNKSTLNEAVRAVTGKSLMEYIRALKIEESRKMIEEHPRYTMEEIAYNCGFNIPSTFYRAFKKQYGFSPSEYSRLAHAPKS